MILELISAVESRELGPGEYEYHFAFSLPQRLPTSFEGAFGYVRFYVRAKVDRPWKFDYEFKRGFTVNAIVDLNRIDQAAVSCFHLHHVTGEREKRKLSLGVVAPSGRGKFRAQLCDWRAPHFNFAATEPVALMAFSEII